MIARAEQRIVAITQFKSKVDEQMVLLSDIVEKVYSLFQDSILSESNKNGVLRQKLKNYTRCFAFDSKKLHALLMDDEKHWQ